MWFKVELDKTGAILTCEQVSMSERQGKLVRYIEAENKANACSQAKAWYDKHRQADTQRERLRQAAKRAAGQCRQCPAQLATFEKSYCASCRERKNERQRERYAGAALIKPRHLTPEQAQAARTKMNRATRDRFNRLWGRHPPSVLKEALAAYDADPKNFRAWLVAAIEHGMPSRIQTQTAEAAE